MSLKTASKYPPKADRELGRHNRFKCFAVDGAKLPSYFATSSPKGRKRHLGRLKLINTQLACIEDEMRELASKDPVLKRKLRYLESIPGVSFIAAATVVGRAFVLFLPFWLITYTSISYSQC